VFYSFKKMHWDRTVARILLIFSVINIARAAPAIVRPTYVGVAEAAPEKRVLSTISEAGETDGSTSELGSDSDSFRHSSASKDSGSDRHISASGRLDDLSFLGSYTSPVHMSPERPPGVYYYDPSWTPPNDYDHFPPNPTHADELALPLHDTVSNDALRKKIVLIGGGFAFMVAASAGIAIGIHKLIKDKPWDKHSHGAYV
jgi:hypothetical protein